MGDIRLESSELKLLLLIKILILISFGGLELEKRINFVFAGCMCAEKIYDFLKFIVNIFHKRH